jgi:hypothetical protein
MERLPLGGEGYKQVWLSVYDILIEIYLKNYISRILVNVYDIYYELRNDTTILKWSHYNLRFS